MKRTLALLLLMIGLGMSGCNEGTDRAGAHQPTPSPSPSNTPAASDTASPQEESGDTDAVPSVENLINPDNDRFKQTAPATFHVKFHTSKGDFIVLVQRDWAPRGADRFYNLVVNGYYDQVRFFRVVDNFVAQFGLHGDPRVNAAWRTQTIPDDPVVKSNTRGTITFATAGPNTRTTQLFINYSDNNQLDTMGFAPFGIVVQGMDVVDAFYSGYGEGAPRGRGPDQQRIHAQGNAYLNAKFPELDYIITARLYDPDAKANTDAP